MDESRYRSLWRRFDYAPIHRCVFEQHILLLDSPGLLHRTDQRHLGYYVRPFEFGAARADGGIHNTDPGLGVEARQQTSIVATLVDSRRGRIAALDKHYGPSRDDIRR